MPTIRAAGGALIALLLADCASNPLDDPTPAQASLTEDMTGRWILAAPNAPPCGINFGGTPGALQGSVTPDGGCPGKFYTSRRWALDRGALVINDDKNRPLAHLTLAGNRFEGQATAGMPVTLGR